ncbi:MAG: transcription elongation factor GreA [Dehalococcoidia bacterium]|nr:transcription elongation factor GreA [Dehalococcoidia bacterium]
MVKKSSYLTQEGYDRLKEELGRLTSVRRHEAVDRIHEAKENGRNSVSDGEYEDAKKDQGFVEGRIRTLENILSNASIIKRDTSHPPDVARLGCKVTVLNQEHKEEQFSLVGSAEASPRHGRISNESPVGQALIGRRIGDQIEVLVPGGVIKFTVTAIE